MKWTKNHDRSGASLRLRWHPRLRLELAALLLLGAVLMVAQQGQQAGQPQISSANKPAPNQSAAAAPPSAAPAAQVKAQNSDAGEAQKKKQIADESARLLALATDLKAEVDKTNKDTLSIPVVRKAGEIERLAHSVKERMKLASVDH